MLILFTRTLKLGLLTLLSRLEMLIRTTTIVKYRLNKIISCCEIGFSPELTFYGLPSSRPLY
jgi:hypothetical protein